MKIVGFIGLGAMGLPMAENLLRAGVTVHGFDIQQEACDKFSMAGGRVANNIDFLAENCQVIFSIVPTAQVLNEILTGPRGLLSHCVKGTVFIDCSTIGVSASRTLHQTAGIHGVRMLDAPVTGGVHGAQSGTLTFMVGGERALFEECHPLLNKMGNKLVYAGPAGAGQAAKICNNMAMGVIKAAISEAFVLAGKLGIDEKTFYAIASTGSAESVALTKTCPVPGLVENSPANRGYQGGFAARLMAKDFGLAEEAAIECGVPIPVAASAANLYRMCTNAGHGNLDIGVVFEYLKTGT